MTQALAAAGAPRGHGAPGGRLLLWVALVGLVAALLATLVWLAGRYESSQFQERLEQAAQEAGGEVRATLARNLQSLQALQAGDPAPAAWGSEAARLLRERREWLRIEWRDERAQGVRAAVDTPFRPAVFDRLGRQASLADVQLACASARRLASPAYSASYFLPQTDGTGLEVMELCMPQVAGGRVVGHLVATYSLAEVLGLVSAELARGRELSFTEADGTRLALRSIGRRGSRVFSAQQLVDLPGHTLVLRVDGWLGQSALFPNVLTALVGAMSVALIAVLGLLARDSRRRQRVEQDLADALAFRKAMEDSLVTGLRARDLAGRITYVNPAFCAMVGFTAQELLGQATPAPYWPPELAADYQKRQDIRLAGLHQPPREGFESVFMRKDGSRFPVLIIEAPLINAQGIQTGWMSAFVDLSEQRRVEELSRAGSERLAAAARLASVGEMASLLSHELNQPLAAIASYATGSMNLLAARLPGPAAGEALWQELRGALERIAAQAQRAGTVIKSVHDMVRRRESARLPVQARALVDAVLPLVQLQARKLGVPVRLELPGDLPPVVCDRTLVEQVLLNLARNALQAMDEARVPEPALLIAARLGARHEADRRAWVEFSVADLGPGIAPAVRDQLFTPFFTTKPEGMGLGLSLCRTVVEQHGGALVFEANRPQGTVFRFTLPAA